MGMSAIEELDRYAEARRTRMGRGELMEPDAGLSRRIVAALEERGADPADLDELVHDAVGAQASSVSNEGMAAQVDYLMKALGGEPLLEALRERLRPTGPSP